MTALTDELKRSYLEIIGRRVGVTMDRPVGTEHPKHAGVFYPINYGYIDGLIGGDGEEQDVYVLGETEPLSYFEGIVIAVVHRYDDDECKWVATREGNRYSKEQIAKEIEFQEQFHDSEIILH